MQTIIQRLHSTLFPFNCLFSTPTLSKNESQLDSNKDLPPPPELPLEIWLEIFQFATHVHQSASIKPLDPFTVKHTTTNAMGANSPAVAMRTKLALVLVSRAWRGMALQMLYQHFVVRSPSRARAILAVLEQSKAREPLELDGYGRWARHIEIYTYMRGSDDIRHLQTAFKILCCCPNLRILSGTWIHRLPVEFLNAISGLYGHRLLGLHWDERAPQMPPNHSTVSTPEFLGSFQSLRILDIRHFVGIDLSTRPKSTPTPTLPLLQDLILSTRPRSLSTATVLNLPSLRNLTLRTPSYDTQIEKLLIGFLEVHGASLVLVDLPSPCSNSELDPDSSNSRNTAVHVNPDTFLKPGRCPNLDAITFPATSPTLAAYEHPTLRRIGLRSIRFDGLYPDRSSPTRDHLMAMTASRYPALELIQTVGFLVEAESDSLTKDIFIWWVEKFEKQGVDFLDGEGVLWAYSEPDLVLCDFKAQESTVKIESIPCRDKMEDRSKNP